MLRWCLLLVLEVLLLIKLGLMLFELLGNWLMLVILWRAWQLMLVIFERSVGSSMVRLHAGSRKITTRVWWLLTLEWLLLQLTPPGILSAVIK